MKSLREYLEEARSKKQAIGHFNISDLVTLRAIFEVAREMEVPVLIGVSEGERQFIGVRQAVALIRSLREEYNYPIFLNADHTHSFQKAKEAADAGFDAVLFDGSALSWEENIRETKAAVEYVRSVNPEIIVEGELGYIGSASQVLKELPKDAAIKPEDLTKPEEALEFVKMTGVDMFAPAVGNLHGMLANAPEPNLDIPRITTLHEILPNTLLVLHGASGNSDEDIRAAVAAGISIVHVNTELRVAWTNGLRQTLADHPEEMVPYKILPGALQNVKDIVRKKLQILSGEIR